MKTAIIILSGGLDSAVAGAIARKDVGKTGKLYAINFDYGQVHIHETTCASYLAEYLEANFVSVQLDFKGIIRSALTNPDEIEIPIDGYTGGVPPTWVPQRNAIFLAHAFAFAEQVDADMIYTGFNSVDYSGYPDCRKEFVEQINKALNLSSKRYIETGRGFSIETPIIHKTKAEIVKIGLELRVPLFMTWSCYAPVLKHNKSTNFDTYFACGECDSCRFRLAAFDQNNYSDPINYLPGKRIHSMREG